MNEVKTFEKARIQSLEKWNKIKNALIKIDNLIDGDCSFCEYSNYHFEKESLSKSTKLGSCICCPVESLCDKLIEIKGNDYNNFINYISELVDELEDMKEENYKSRHQLKGGE